MRIGLVIAIAAAAGLVGGLATTLLRPPAPPEAAAGGARDGAATRLADLEVALARLEERVRTLEVAPPLPAAGSRSGAPGAAEGTGGGAAAPPAGVDGTGATGPELDERIRVAMEERERAEREERQKRIEEVMARREKEFRERLQNEFGLTPWQADQVLAILTKRREAFMALRDRMMEEGLPPEPPSPELRGSEFQKIQDEADKELQAILSADQYEVVRKAITEQYGPGWMGGPGRGLGPPRGR